MIADRVISCILERRGNVVGCMHRSSRYLVVGEQLGHAGVMKSIHPHYAADADDRTYHSPSYVYHTHTTATLVM